MKGPPSIAGFLTAAACDSGEAMYESMILRWRCETLRAAGAGGIKCAQAYHRSTSGSTSTFGFRYSFCAFIPKRTIQFSYLRIDNQIALNAPNFLHRYSYGSENQRRSSQ